MFIDLKARDKFEVLYTIYDFVDFCKQISCTNTIFLHTKIVYKICTCCIQKCIISLHFSSQFIQVQFTRTTTRSPRCCWRTASCSFRPTTKASSPSAGTSTTERFVSARNSDFRCTIDLRSCSPRTTSLPTSSLFTLLLLPTFIKRELIQLKLTELIELIQIKYWINCNFELFEIN